MLNIIEQHGQGQRLLPNILTYFSEVLLKLKSYDMKYKIRLGRVLH